MFRPRRRTCGRVADVRHERARPGCAVTQMDDARSIGQPHDPKPNGEPRHVRRWPGRGDSRGHREPTQNQEPRASESLRSRGERSATAGRSSPQTHFSKIVHGAPDRRRGVGRSGGDARRLWRILSKSGRGCRGASKGSPPVYQWLVMRQGVDTVKPDVHVRRFAEAAVVRKLNDQDVIELTTPTAARIGIKALELDWRIWEAARGGALPYPTAPA
jgi:hypothetical protein